MAALIDELKKTKICGRPLIMEDGHCSLQALHAMVSAICMSVNDLVRFSAGGLEFK